MTEQIVNLEVCLQRFSEEVQSDRVGSQVALVWKSAAQILVPFFDIVRSSASPPSFASSGSAVAQDLQKNRELNTEGSDPR